MTNRIFYLQNFCMNFCGGVVAGPPQKNPQTQQHMIAAFICSNFINSAAQVVEMLINIDTSVTVFLKLTIKYQFETYKIFLHILSGIAMKSV